MEKALAFEYNQTERQVLYVYHLSHRYMKRNCKNNTKKEHGGKKSEYI